MKKSLITLFFVLIVFISSYNALYKRLEPTIFGTQFVPHDIAINEGSSTLFVCGDVSGDYYLNINEYNTSLSNQRTGVIIISDIQSSEFSTILLIPSNDNSFTTLTKIQIIDQDTTLILGTSNSKSLSATNFQSDIIPLITEGQTETYSFILTIVTSKEDKDSIDIRLELLDDITTDFSAEEKFYYVTDSQKENTPSVILYNIIQEDSSQTIFSNNNIINSVDLVNQTLVIIEETFPGKTSLSFIDINNHNSQHSIVSFLHEDDKFSIEDVSTILEDDKIIIYFFGNYKEGANINFPPGSACTLTFVENSDHIYIAKYVIDQSLHVIDCLSITDTSSKITQTGVSLSVSTVGVALLGNFEKLEGARGNPIIQFGNDDNCQKPSLSDENPTNFIAIFNIDTLECIEMGTFVNVVTANASSYPVIGTNVVMHGHTPIIMFYNSSITIENKELSMGILYLIIPLAQPPQPGYPDPSSVISSETSIGEIDSSSSHPRHTVHSLTSFDESTEEEVVIPWYSTLIVIFLLVGAVIGTVVLYNVYVKYKRTKNNVETRKHRFARVPINDEEDNI